MISEIFFREYFNLIIRGKNDFFSHLFIFFNDVITPLLVLGTLAVVGGVILLTFQKNEGKSNIRDFRIGILFALIIGITWGIAPVLLKYAVTYVDIFYVNGVRLMLQVPILFVMLILQKDLLSSFKIIIL